MQKPATFRFDSPITGVYIDGCSFASGMPAVNNSYNWSRFIPNSKNNSYPGKDNFNIFIQTMWVIHTQSPKTILVYWTYPERFGLYQYAPNEDDPNRVITIPVNKDLCRYGDTGVAYNEYVKCDLTYILTIQEECKRKNINFKFLTTAPYFYYERADHGLLNLIDHSNCANWPGPALLENYHIFCNSLQALFGCYYKCMSHDLMHIDADGHMLFYEKVIHPLLNNRPIDQPWHTLDVVNWLNQALTDDQKIRAASQLGLESLRDIRSTKTTNFIYES